MPGLQLAGGRGVECGHRAARAPQEQGQNQVRTVGYGEGMVLVQYCIFQGSLVSRRPNKLS